jgi:hypothetical protein
MPRFTAHLQTQNKLGFHFLYQSSYSPDLAPSDYYLFRGLKQIEMSPFTSDTVVVAAAETCLDGQISDIFLSGLQKIQH